MRISTFYKPHNRTIDFQGFNIRYRPAAAALLIDVRCVLSFLLGPKRCVQSLEVLKAFPCPGNARVYVPWNGKQYFVLLSFLLWLLFFSFRAEPRHRAKEWFFVHSSKMYESEVEKSCVREEAKPTHIHIWWRILPDWRRHYHRQDQEKRRKQKALEDDSICQLFVGTFWLSSPLPQKFLYHVKKRAWT